jgi:AraC family transcriptional regulator, ethanolamine operon transcriptional activator
VATEFCIAKPTSLCIISFLLQSLMARPDLLLPAFAQVEAQIFDAILDMIPSAEIIEPFHHRARIARTVLKFLKERLDNPPTITELCIGLAAKERTLYLSCVEALGRPLAVLRAELRLNAAHRALSSPTNELSVTSVAACYGFTHFGRFASIYRRQFDEPPSATFARPRGWVTKI